MPPKARKQEQTAATPKAPKQEQTAETAEKEPPVDGGEVPPPPVDDSSDDDEPLSTRLKRCREGAAKDAREEDRLSEVERRMKRIEADFEASLVWMIIHLQKDDGMTMRSVLQAVKEILPNAQTEGIRRLVKKYTVHA